MHRGITPALLALGILAVPLSSLFAQPGVAVTGTVLTPEGNGIENVTVTVFRQGTQSRGVTSRAGGYKIELPAGSFIDYIVFERNGVLPRVLAGPFPGTASSQINVVLMASNIKAMSLPATLATIQAIQFLKLVLKRTDAQLPGALTIQPELKLAAEAVASGAGRDATRGGAGGGGDRDQTKAAAFWPMDDPFFASLGAGR